MVKVLVLSIDPYIRGKMRPEHITSYAPAYHLGKPIYGYGIGKVLRSENIDYSKGDYVTSGLMNFAEYWIPTSSDLAEITKFTPEPKLPLSVYLGAAGMPEPHISDGKFTPTLKRHVNHPGSENLYSPQWIQQGELAKSDGMKVIASVGSDEKVRQCKEFGADIAFNYKTENAEEILAQEGPVDVYWDNVGGSALDAALGNASLHARVIMCGFISQYNFQSGFEYKNISNILFRRIAVHGFLVWEHEAQWYDRFYIEVPKKLISAELKYTEDISRGLHKCGEAILEVQIGKNNGKKIVIVADDEDD
ncbi:hypothetical protein VKT23_012166 [Stygiomarasmius scandens]|uniref:Uncharacterized protein n=1 Tax=Marasmiellus scandens TaxID=2682957 RepID=A0ABR1JAG3_9AGAR